MANNAAQPSHAFAHATAMGEIVEVALGASKLGTQPGLSSKVAAGRIIVAALFGKFCARGYRLEALARIWILALARCQANV